MVISNNNTDKSKHMCFEGNALDSLDLSPSWEKSKDDSLETEVSAKSPLEKKKPQLKISKVMINNGKKSFSTNRAGLMTAVREQNRVHDTIPPVYQKYQNK